MTKYQEIFAALADTFRDGEVRRREVGGGRYIRYITARIAQNRLDEVLGPENWWCSYRETREGLICSLSICLPDGAVITKEDGGGPAGMQAKDDDEKSAFSDAFKRACVCFGVARYLYQDGVPSYARAEELAPQPARESGDDDIPAGSGRDRMHDGDRSPAPVREGQPPRSGKAMFAWTKAMEQKHGVLLLGYLNRWAKNQGYPYRMLDWNADQVTLAHAEAERKLSEFKRVRADEDIPVNA